MTLPFSYDFHFSFNFKIFILPQFSEESACLYRKNPFVSGGPWFHGLCRLMQFLSLNFSSNPGILVHAILLPAFFSTRKMRVSLQKFEVCGVLDSSAFRCLRSFAKIVVLASRSIQRVSRWSLLIFVTPLAFRRAALHLILSGCIFLWP